MTNPAMEKAKAALHAQLSKDGTIEDMVRAVLLAVREPDPAFAYEACFVENDQLLPDAGFTAMIDAILSTDTAEGVKP